MDPAWILQYDPLADCTFSETGTQVSIAIPAGVAHDLFSSNKNAPRLLQAGTDEDFTLETKVDSALTIGNQSAGIVVEQDHNNLLTFSYTYNGYTTKIVVTRMIAGTSVILSNITLEAASYPLYLRVERVKSTDQWTFYTSADGITWTERHVFTHALAVAYSGLFAATANTNPALTALFDYFHVDTFRGYLTISGVIHESNADTVTSTIDVNIKISGNISEASEQYPSDNVYCNVAVIVGIVGNITESQQDFASGTITVGDYVPEPTPVDPDVLLNLFVHDTQRVNSNIDINSQAARAFYNEIRGFALRTKPWQAAFFYEVKPDETLDFTLVSERVYGRRDEYLVVMAAAGINTSDQVLEQKKIILPTEEQLYQIKVRVGFESQAELREDYQPVWIDQ